MTSRWRLSLLTSRTTVTATSDGATPKRGETRTVIPGSAAYDGAGPRANAIDTTAFIHTTAAPCRSHRLLQRQGCRRNVRPAAEIDESHFDGHRVPRRLAAHEIRPRGKSPRR